MTRNKRHKIIDEVIRNNDIWSQNMLLKALIDKGFEITQATLSRDIKELRIMKVPNNTGGYSYRFADSTTSMPEDTHSSLGFKFISFEFSAHLAVAKTKPGYAMAIAAEIDRVAIKEILGTVAGDDTILLIPKEGVTRNEVIEILADFIPHGIR